MSDKLAEAIERVRNLANTHLYQHGEDAERAAIVAVCDAAARCAEAEDCARESAEIMRRVREDRDRLQETLLVRHGGEPLALLAELDEARAERDAASATLAGIERLLRERLTLGYLPRLHWPDGREYMIWNTARVLGTGTTLAAAVQAALDELDKETK